MTYYIKVRVLRATRVYSTIQVVCYYIILFTFEVYQLAMNPPRK